MLIRSFFVVASTFPVTFGHTLNIHQRAYFSLKGHTKEAYFSLKKTLQRNLL